MAAEEPDQGVASGTEDAAQDLLRQRNVHKTLEWVAEKQERGLAESDIRTTLTRVRLPNAQIVRQSGAAELRISVADSDPRDPIRGADQDPRDPFLWRTDLDPTDPARREDRPPGF